MIKHILVDHIKHVVCMCAVLTMSTVPPAQDQ